MSKALTAAAVDKLKPDPVRRLEVPDGLLVGLYLVVQTSGKKSWAVRFRVGGKPKKLTLGRFPAMTLEEAREVARAALRDAQKGIDPTAAKRAAKSVPSIEAEADRNNFEVIARQYLDRYAKPNTRSWVETARALGLVYDPAIPAERDNPKSFITLKGAIISRWHRRHVSTIGRRDVIELLDGMVDSGKPIAANKALAIVRKFFGWCVERDIIHANPAAGVKAPAAAVERDRVLSDDELRAVWIAASELGDPYCSAVRLLILTGQRRDEVAGMSLREIEGAVWTIPRARAKNDVEHVVPLSAAAQAVIEGVPKIAAERRLVFSTSGQTPISGWSKMKTKLDREALRVLRERATHDQVDPADVVFPDWHLHDIRRTVATGMARLGIDLPVIGKVLNHVSGSFAGIVGVYQRHTYADEKKRALDAWGAFVIDLILDRSEKLDDASRAIAT